MIIECRTNPSFAHGYDIVEGKIADDSVGETILFVIDGVIKKEDAIERYVVIVDSSHENHAIIHAQNGTSSIHQNHFFIPTILNIIYVL